MCLIILAENYSPEYKLIVGANRDEFYSRPAEQAHIWKEDIIGGKDMKAGGMWLGISKTGRFAAVTNFRKGLSEPSKNSRGEIVKQFVAGNIPGDSYSEILLQKPEEYNGFNLICGYPDELFYYSNIRNSYQKIANGIHGLSNAFLDSPWPKVKYSIQKFKKIIDAGDTDFNKIFELLKDSTEADDNELPDTGIDHDLEKKLSPVFIEIDGYGTRCSTVLTVDYDNNLDFSERSYGSNGVLTGEVNISFKLDIKKPVR